MAAGAGDGDWIDLLGGDDEILAKRDVLHLPCLAYFMVVGVRPSHQDLQMRGSENKDNVRTRGIRKFIPMIIHGMQEETDNYGCDVLSNDPHTRKRKCRMFVQTFRDWHDRLNDPLHNNPLAWFYDPTRIGRDRFRLDPVIFPSLKQAVVNAVEMIEWNSRPPPGVSTYAWFPFPLPAPLPATRPRYKIRDQTSNRVTNASMKQVFIFGSGRPITDYKRVTNFPFFADAEHANWLRCLWWLAKNTWQRGDQARIQIRAASAALGPGGFVINPDPNVPPVPRVRQDAEPRYLPLENMWHSTNIPWPPAAVGAAPIPDVQRPTNQYLRILLNQALNNYVGSQIVDDMFNPNTVVGQDLLIKQLMAQLKTTLKSEKGYFALENKLRARLGGDMVAQQGTLAHPVPGIVQAIPAADHDAVADWWVERMSDKATFTLPLFG